MSNEVSSKVAYKVIFDGSYSYITTVEVPDSFSEDDEFLGLYMSFEGAKNRLVIQLLKVYTQYKSAVERARELKISDVVELL